MYVMSGHRMTFVHIDGHLIIGKQLEQARQQPVQEIARPGALKCQGRVFLRDQIFELNRQSLRECCSFSNCRR